MQCALSSVTANDGLWAVSYPAERSWTIGGLSDQGVRAQCGRVAVRVHTNRVFVTMVLGKVLNLTLRYDSVSGSVF